MKTFIKTLVIILAVLIIAAFVLPFAFKGKIIELVKQEANNNLNATVDFSHFNLSLFRSFPDFTLEIRDLTLVGVDEFQNDTLADISSFYVSIDFMSVIKGENYEVKSVSIDHPNLHIKILESGKANWDIVKYDDLPEEPETVEVEESSSYRVTLNKISIVDAKIIYQDESIATVLYINGLNHTLKGDLTADKTTLRTNTTTDDFTLLMDGIKYLDHAGIKLDADIDADLANSKYTLSKNELQLNNLFLVFDGYFKMLEESYEMDINFKASRSDFRNFLSLIPAIYAKDFEEIKTAGNLAFEGFVRGIYADETLPAFRLDISVDDAMFKYPDLPGSVENITINAKIANSGIDADNTEIDIKKLHFEISENPVDLVMQIKTPVSDPFIDGHLQAEIDMSKIKDVYPLVSGEELNGNFTANIYLKGNMSSIENEQYQDFKAIGSLLCQDFSYKSPELPYGIEIKNAQLNFSPAYLDLIDFSALIGQSDISASGKISNYMAYVFNDEMIEGNFNTTSNYFNFNDLMPEGEESEETASAEDTIPMSIIEVPSNIDFFLSSAFDKIIYDKMEMTDVAGAVIIRNKQVMLRDLNMKLLEGSMTVDGIYSTQDSDAPKVDFALDIKDFDIQKSFATFGTMGKLAPVAKHAYGKFSTKMIYNSLLDKEMMPVLSSMSGKGNLTTTKIKLKDVKALDKIADALKMNDLKNLELEKLNISFEFKDGKVEVKPYDIKYKNISGIVSGTTSFDKQIDYNMKLQIPRSEFGEQANKVLDGLISQAKEKGVEVKMTDIVNVDVTIGGTMDDPVVRTGVKDLTKSASEQLKSQLEDEIEAKKKELQEKANEELEKAKKEAEEKLKEEKEKAAAEAERLKKEAEEKAKEEAEKLKKKAEEEAKKKLKKLF